MKFVSSTLNNMSIVGLRPVFPNEVAAYTDYQRQRLMVKLGIAHCWLTRFKRNAITFDEWADFDLLNIKKHSVRTDFKLIIQKVSVVLTAQGS